MKQETPIEKLDRITREVMGMEMGDGGYDLRDQMTDLIEVVKELASEIGKKD